MLDCDVSGALFIDLSRSNLETGKAEKYLSHFFSIPHAFLTHRAVAPGLTLLGDHPSRPELVVLKAVIYISLLFYLVP